MEKILNRSDPEDPRIISSDFAEPRGAGLRGDQARNSLAFSELAPSDFEDVVNRTFTLYTRPESRSCL